MDVKQQLGLRIKALRNMRGYSQERLAEIMGVNSKYLSSVERGKENPTLDFFLKLAAGLKVTIQPVFCIETISDSPKTLRTKLRILLNDVKDEELSRTVRIIESLIR
jgi:transcriptional regulator with XRE-family HTH domain